MKPLFTFLLVIGCAIVSNAQVTTETLDHNNVNAKINNSGSIFNGDLYSGYEIPKGSGNHLIFSGQFWFAGKDANGSVYTSLGGIENVGTDIDHGPFSSTGMYNDPTYDAPFVVTLCQEEIDNYVLWQGCQQGTITVGCSQATQPSAETLNRIYSWPAHGNVLVGQAYFMAPFYDMNQDGMYDPVNSGDYPLIKGCCATYMIQNDDGNVHTYSGGDPIGMEMHYMFYQFGGNDDLYNTTFVDVMAINRGTRDYPEFISGFYVDGTLGNYSDDYFASDSLSNSMIFYNGDNLDENGYGINPPAFGVVALETPILSVTPVTMFSTSASATWSRLNGIMPSGAPYLDPTGNPTKFVFNGNPNDNSEWSEISEGTPPGSRRGLISTHHGTINAGDTVIQSYAIVFSEGGNHRENAENVSNLANWAKTFYDTEINGGCEAGTVLNTIDLNQDEFSIYPNPTTGAITIETTIDATFNFEVIDVSGRKVISMQDQFGIAKLNLSGHQSGVYLVRIQTETQTIVERIVLR